MLRLTDNGVAFAAELGCPIRKSEWDILVERHNAEEHSRHAFAVLLFAFQARRRGWRVEICPKVDSPRVEPDVLVEKDGERVYVEVEVLRNPRRRRDGADNTWVRKWRNQYAFQGRVALCAADEEGRAKLVRDCKAQRLGGVATDLHALSFLEDGETLRKMAEIDPQVPLWMERW